MKESDSFSRETSLSFQDGGIEILQRTNGQTRELQVNVQTMENDGFLIMVRKTSAGATKILGTEKQKVCMMLLLLSA